MSKQRLAVFAAVLLTAVAIVYAAIVTPPGSPLRARAQADAPLPSEPLPVVEPMELKAVSPETAREINDATPYADVANPPARPFNLGGGPSADRATDCLAAAGYYEAGDDTEGQRSVMQVVLNRVRHPAFPKSVCGVVFQGQERATGCQFTFTCDGAMIARKPSAAAWERARATARQALSGRVYAPVGVATHYHTDWVVPYWSSSLLKLTKVKTHLFFRWPGGWGSLAALRGGYAGSEPGVAKLAALSTAHVGAAVDEDGNPIETLDGVAPSLASVRKVLFRSDEEYLVLLKPGMAAGELPGAARALCGETKYCKLRGWTDAAVAPTTLPVKDAQRDAMAFSYLRDPDRKFERLLWNCRAYPSVPKDDCIKGTYAKPDGKDEKLAGGREGKEKVSLRSILGIGKDDDDKPEKKAAEEKKPAASDNGGVRRRPGQE